MIQKYAPFETRWDPFTGMRQLQRELDRVFRGFGFNDDQGAVFPAINLYASETEAVVTAEVPGIDPNNIEVSVRGDTFTISGSREDGDLGEEATWHRRERPRGKFSRTISLPFAVDSEKVRADARHGIVRVILPRAEADKTRRITIENK